MFVLDLLGTLSLRSDNGPVPRTAHQKRPLGLLALLALGGKQGMSRHRVEAFLWSESTSAKARHALDQTIYAIRRTLGGDVILATGQDLRLNPDRIRPDVWSFDDAMDAKEWTTGAELYKGALLDGFHFGDSQSQELESWIDSERTRLLHRYQTAVESLADQSARAGDHSQDVAWRRKLASSDPLSAGRSTKLIQALAASGDRAAAVKHARQYQERIRHELEIEPDSAIERLASSLSRPSRPAAISSPLPKASPASVVAPPSEFASSKPAGMDRSRFAAIASVSVIAVLALAAVTVKNGASTTQSAGAGENSSVLGRRAPLPAARDAYLLGINALEDRTREGSDNAVVYFRRAAELDPRYAEAYAQLAEAYVRIGYFGYRPANAMFPKAKAAAQRSIELDGTLASARTALATELIWEHDFTGAETEYRKAISLEPANATAHQWYGVLHMILGKRAEAVAEEKIASDLEPLSLQIQNNYATFMNVLDHPAALRQFQKTVGEEPDSAWVRRNPWLLSNMSRVYADNGDYVSAMRMINQALKIVPGIPRAVYALASIHDRMGRPDLARRAFIRADTSSEQYATYKGMMYADQGNADSAFAWFDRQQNWGIQTMLSLQAEWHIAPLRRDPRYRLLLERLRIPTNAIDRVKK